MIWVIAGLALAAISGWAIVALTAGKRADDQVASAAAERDRAAAVAERDQAVTELAEVRAGAAATATTLRAEIASMERDLETCTDPDVRRARWGRLLATVAEPVPGVPERGSDADAGPELVRTGDLDDAGTRSAGRDPDRSLS